MVLVVAVNCIVNLIFTQDELFRYCKELAQMLLLNN